MTNEITLITTEYYDFNKDSEEPLKIEKNFTHKPLEEKVTHGILADFKGTYLIKTTVERVKQRVGEDTKEVEPKENNQKPSFSKDYEDVIRAIVKEEIGKHEQDKTFNRASFPVNFF